MTTVEETVAPACEPVKSCTSCAHEFTALSAEVAEKVVKQVEFYFSDVNLPKDKFLQAEISKNVDGWVSLQTICSFSRMRALTEEAAAVAAALKASSELVEVSECGEKVRRSPAKPMEAVDNMKTGIFIRNFPTTMTLDDLQAFFAKGTICEPEQISAIRMRRKAESKEFKGSVFVIFKSEEEAARVAALKTAVFTEEVSLEIMDMLAFMEEQNAKAMARKRKSNTAEASIPAEPLTLEQVKAMLLACENCPRSLEHRTLRSALGAYGPIAFVESVNAEGVSVARFKEPCAAEIIEKLAAENGLKVADSTLAVRAVTEEEATAFLDKLNSFKASEKPVQRYNNKRYKRN